MKNELISAQEAAGEALEACRDPHSTPEERAAMVEGAFALLGLENAEDAARYRWLRDVSVPPHNFYLSVPDEFKDERYTPAQVDAAIDAARARLEGSAA